MKSKDELKTKYRGRSIKQIESTIRSSLDASREKEREAIEALAYLEKTSRFKENPQYKKSTFERYLEWEWNMKYGRFVALKNAWVHWPEPTKKYGSQTMAKVITRVGPKRMESLVSAVSRKEKANKRPLRVEELDDTAKKIKPPKKPAKPPKAVNYEAEWKREREARIELESKLRKAEETVREQSRLIHALRKRNAELEHRGTGHPVIPVHPSIAQREAMGA